MSMTMSRSIRKTGKGLRTLGRRLHKYHLLDMRMKLLLLEAFVFLGWARILKARPFLKIAPSLGEQMAETAIEANPAEEETIIRVSRAVRLMSRFTWWESKCLVMAIAGMKMLERRGIESTLYLGTGKDASGKMIAHAWLRSGTYYLTGAEEMNRFTVVAKFGKFMDSKGRRGASHV
jgi:hypothetical protein